MTIVAISINRDQNVNIMGTRVQNSLIRDLAPLVCVLFMISKNSTGYGDLLWAHAVQSFY